MLQQMRAFSKSWFASGLLILVMGSFVIWGVADVFRASVDYSVATVGGIKIETAEFQREYQNTVKNQGAKMGTVLTGEQARSLGLPQETLQRIISRTAVDSVVKRLGLTASDSAVASQIREIPAFQGATGNFDRQHFLEVVQQSGFTEQAFINAVRSDTARSQLISATAQGLQMPAGYAKAIFDYLNERRAVAYITVPANASGPIPAPSDADLEVYIHQHPQRFSTPEYREFSYAALAPDDVAAQIQVTGKDLRTEYEVHRAEYQVPEKRVVEQISFPDLKSAEAGEARLASGLSFEDLAISRGLKPSDIQLGAIAQADLGGERGAAAFALSPNQVSKPVKGLAGYVLLKVTAINPGVNKTFDQVKDALLASAKQKLAAEKIGDIVNKLEDTLAGGATLAEAAKANGLKFVHVKAADAHGLAPDGSTADIPPKPQFLAQLVKTEPGQPGDPFTTPDGAAYVIKIDGNTPPKLKPLTAVRSEALAQWSAQKAQDAMLDKVKALTAQANRDGSLDGVAKAAGAKAEASGALLRSTQSEIFPAFLTGQIFDAAPGASVMGKTADGSKYIIARITGIAHPPAGIEQLPQYAQFKAQLANQIANDIPTSVAMAAREREGVSINKKNFDAVTGGAQ